MKFIYNKNYWSHYYSLIAFFTIFLFGISGAYASDFDKLKEVPCSIVVESKPLRNVFESIEDQTEYNIVCFDQTALLNNKVTINAPKSNLETVLQKIAGIQDISFTLNGKNIIVKPHKKEPAPQKIINSSVLIKGVITDSKNQPVPGAAQLDLVAIGHIVQTCGRHMRMLDALDKLLLELFANRRRQFAPFFQRRLDEREAITHRARP
mgnify:CR=1 FL=1